MLETNILQLLLGILEEEAAPLEAFATRKAGRLDKWGRRGPYLTETSKLLLVEKQIPPVT